MNLELKPDLQKFIDEQVVAGRFRSPEEVVEAGLTVLRQQDDEGDFLPGELDELLAKGLASIEQGQVHDGESVFREIEQMSKARQEQAK